VRVTFRLTDSPACLVADEHELSANLVRMLKAAGQDAPESKPILEINPNHPLVTRLKYEDAASPRFGDWAHILFDQAMLAEGGSLTDPAAFVKRSERDAAGYRRQIKTTVAPAEAGAQVLRATTRRKTWVPAFAGTTVLGRRPHSRAN
jgi:hypothetical protein